ncbi:hypothetical protein [Streptomyces justiciae]|uniref:Uncharacterized protein n=1 Tax=Streptomyces justiciae TaxID=2780140 RepID=A0ABU3LRT4_9ACTN|nr:hypothetical protein [Streptomyces justiciae]MDT7841873.1 hypothetical protein [Streptomyces justiciae]
MADERLVQARAGVGGVLFGESAQRGRDAVPVDVVEVQPGRVSGVVDGDGGREDRPVAGCG